MRKVNFIKLFTLAIIGISFVPKLSGYNFAVHS